MKVRNVLLSIIIFAIAIFSITSCVSTRSTAVIQRIDEEDVEIRGAVPASSDSIFSEPSREDIYDASIDEAIRACSRYDREPEILSYSVSLLRAGVGFFYEWEYFVLYACIETESE